ncbi:YraN family protein [Candidatus Acetothermia bacterium]|jgi:putative endonuclease|nr:YraN family protein [Candidatus Acetothermia bacterium]MCI2427149.1 YraN family protein [Candidatus Acetothermia bacterium]MCI2428671.1 YraN family protein [Candidatus Acetothermia bacterium]
MIAQRAGVHKEKEAVTFLRSHGYAIIARNWWCRFGEIDIIARDGDQLVFVEVRARSTETHGSPEETITPLKRKHIIAAAKIYLAGKDCDLAVRFDVVAISGNDFRLYKNAFTGDD